VRSFGVGLVAMAPNLGPVVIFFGLLGAGLADLSLPTSLIGSVALGIALDDTAHFIVNYQRHARRGLAAADAAARCLRELGLPIVTTSVMLTAGYLVLMLSGFATIRQFGWLSALTIQICLWGDLLMLPRSSLARASDADCSQVEDEVVARSCAADERAAVGGGFDRVGAVVDRAGDERRLAVWQTPVRQDQRTGTSQASASSSRLA
jgi:predicted exporter